MKHILKDLGLTPHEVTIYQMLLSSGASGTGEISQKTGIHRRNIYDCLERMMQKGLVTYIKENNRKQFMLTNPKRILEKYQEREQEVTKALPELLAQYKAAYEHKETVIYKGKNGIRLVMEDQLREGKEILVNATTTDVSNILKYFFPKYQLIRKEKNIPTRMLFDKSYATKENKKGLSKLPLSKVKYLKGLNKSPMSQYVYGKNVAIIVWGDDPLAILIRQKAVAQGFRDNFEVLWNVAE